MKNADICDANVTLRQVKDWVRAFCAERGWEPYHGAKDLAIGLVTEASELLEIFRFVPEARLSEFMREPEVRVRVADELADSLYFILRFAELNHFDLSQAVHAKLIKNAIKYPVPEPPAK